ncbi:Signal recognition particle protein [Buchnera aphidicola (Eriosoma lanigerum)]|uniref:signal recognition particle protein n=1 Tax=Buchnera aphidicola TaxID=9 RepID=UPI00346435C7
MFNKLTESLTHIIKNISNQGRITETNIQKILREIRKALLEADVSLSVIQNFISSIKKKFIGSIVNKSLTPGQEFLKIIKQELIIIMGNNNSKINLSTTPPAIILVIGLQGVGKTTTVAKLGKFIKENKKKKILITSTDVYRLAAIKQLQILSKKINIDYFSTDITNEPLKIAQQALEYTKSKLYDILIIDTAGRLHTNITMMNEIKNIHQIINPIETLLVVDSMMGQDSINMINIFNNSIPITGVILTKIDGDARGGIALSIRYLTNIPIKLIGNGEQLNKLQIFNPEQIASRILGMHDMLSVIKEIEEKVDTKQVKNITTNINKGDKFNLNDFLIQIKQINNMDNMVDLLKKLPNNQMIIKNFDSYFNKKIIIKVESIINSMTPKERNTPDIIKGSRKKRIATGSGIPIYEINNILKKFEEMKKMIKKIKHKGIHTVLKNIKNSILKNNIF